MKRLAMILTACILGIGMLCACGSDQEGAYEGPALTDLMEYKIPDGYAEWSTESAGGYGSAVTGIDFAEDSGDATQPCMSLDLEQYDGVRTSADLEPIDMDEAKEDSQILKEIEVDGETGYIMEDIYDSEDGEYRNLSLLVEHDGAIFSFRYDAPRTDQTDKVFYQFIDSMKFKDQNN